jgi:predicted nucleic acid-binding protein
MTRKRPLRLFLDSNVLIESVFLPDSAASAIIKLTANGTFDVFTCQPVITDVENAILKKLKNNSERLNKIIDRWEGILSEGQITVFPAPADQIVQKTYKLYISAMRHKADIQILAAALLAKPDVILSGNREHFNDLVAHRCGIRICSCLEFIEGLATSSIQ